MSIDKNIENVILFQLDKTSKLAKQHSQRQLEKRGMNITVEQWVILKIVEENDGVSQKVIAEKSYRDPASITRTLDLLQKKGLLNRLPIPTNRRQYQIVMTKEGKAFVQKHMDFVQSLRDLSVSGFSIQELETLSGYLQRIQQNMEEE